MEEDRLDNELERLYKKFTFLWEDYGFHVKYFTRDYGRYCRGFIIGLENDVCKLAFIKEANSSTEPIAEYVGRIGASFKLSHSDYSLQYGWYPLTGLTLWLTGIEYEFNKDVDKDLENVSRYLKLHIDKLIDLFKFPKEFEKKLEYYRNLHKENQITLEKIREERARLQALGQDSSLEAALNNLRRGKQ